MVLVVILYVSSDSLVCSSLKFPCSHSRSSGLRYTKESLLCVAIIRAQRTLHSLSGQEVSDSSVKRTRFGYNHMRKRWAMWYDTFNLSRILVRLPLFLDQLQASMYRWSAQQSNRRAFLASSLSTISMQMTLRR